MYNHAYFQELSREQLKVFFNYMIDHIDIRELENIGDDPKVYLAITIHLKLKWVCSQVFHRVFEEYKHRRKTKSKSF